MNSAPHLLNEDREEFARILDEALRTAEYRPDLGTSPGRRLNIEQLRTMALSATTAIAACATAEYQHYCELRDKFRSPTSSPMSTGKPGGEDGDESAASGSGLATTMGEVTDAAGAGLAAMVTVLAPVLAGIAAVLFLAIGYILHTLNPDESMAEPLISVGWIFAALTAAGFLIAMGGLVVTALRNGSTSLRATRGGELAREVDRAHTAWRSALLERGLLPFLREALSDPAAAANSDPHRYVPRRGEDDGTSRMPGLGYTRPGFSSPEGGPPGASRPRFTSPDFTSPDYGGPDHLPD